MGCSDLSILGIGGRISDLCDYPLTILVLFGDFFSYFLAVVWVFVVSSFCLISVSV